MIGIIAAVSPDSVIGLDGELPWSYPEDLNRFKRVTGQATLVMGRLTWESLPRRPLPGRRNIVITRRAQDAAVPTEGPLAGAECFVTIGEALDTIDGDCWFIGGARIYREALHFADRIDLTRVPDRISGPGAVYFPDIDPERWVSDGVIVHEDDSRLMREVFNRQRS